jgi:hypothetical protein
MNATIKTILLTVLTLSVFTIALVELSGVSENSLSDLFESKGNRKKDDHTQHLSNQDQAKRDEEVKKMPKTTIEVAQTKFDFGKITDGDKVSHTYVVKNIGDKPLVISNVQTSCGCTAPFFPKEPILPGQEGNITLEFNSAGKSGLVNKNALIIGNADNAPFSIGFTADVQAKK